MNGRPPKPEQVARWAERKVRPGSVLGEALTLQDILGDNSKPYGDLLEKIANHPAAESAFEAVVERHRYLPNSERLAERLLHYVITAAASSRLANPSTAKEKSAREESAREEHGLPQRLSVAERRVQVDERFKPMFEALTVLEVGLAPLSNTFDIKSSVVSEGTRNDNTDAPSTAFVDYPAEGLGDDEATISLTNMAPYVGETNQDLQSAVAGYAVALGHDGTNSGDLTTNYWRDRLLYMKSIPTILDRLRGFLEDQRRRDLLALAGFPTGRNQRQEPDRKAFTLMLSRYVKQTLSEYDHVFVCEMLDIMFPRKNSYQVAAVARLLQLEADRRKTLNSHAGADGSNDDERNFSLLPQITNGS